MSTESTESRQLLRDRIVIDVLIGMTCVVILISLLLGR